MGKFKAPKYGNKKTRGFDSKKEANHAVYLRSLERSGDITDLTFQVRFELLPAQKVGKTKERAVHYIVDFCYVDKAGKFHIVDVKGMRTPLYILKRKLMLFIHSLVVEEV